MFSLLFYILVYGVALSYICVVCQPVIYDVFVYFCIFCKVIVEERRVQRSCVVAQFNSCFDVSWQDAGWRWRVRFFLVVTVASTAKCVDDVSTDRYVAIERSSEDIDRRYRRMIVASRFARDRRNQNHTVEESTPGWLVVVGSRWWRVTLTRWRLHRWRLRLHTLSSQGVRKCECNLSWHELGWLSVVFHRDRLSTFTNGQALRSDGDGLVLQRCWLTIYVRFFIVESEDSLVDDLFILRLVEGVQCRAAVVWRTASCRK